MKLSKTNKTILIIGAVYIIFTLFIALYLKKEEPAVNQSQERVFIEDYEVSGNILKSDQAGFSIEIPEGWEARKYGKGMGIIKEEILEEGMKKVLCLISVDIASYKGTAEIERVSNLIDKVQRGEKEDDADYRYRTADISGRTFLKTEFYDGEETIYVIAETAQDNKVYSVNSGLIAYPECLEGFNASLNTVSIK